MRSEEDTGRPAQRTGIRRALAPFEEWTTREIVVAAVLAAAVGVIFWGWGLLVGSLFTPALFPYSYLLVGVWMVGGLLVPYVIRRPGAALFGELVAAFVSMAMGNLWGFWTMASGLVQGVGSEVVFAGFGWKRFTGPTLYLAAGLAGVFSVLLDTFVYSYYNAALWPDYTGLGSWGNILVAMLLGAISSMVLGGGLSQLLGTGLSRTGVLSGLGVHAGRTKRI